MGKYRDEDYLRTTWWVDRDVTIRAHTVKMVTTRKPHTCAGNGTDEQHEIPAGSRALYERCLYDEEWGQCWLCTSCMDNWIDKVGL